MTWRARQRRENKQKKVGDGNGFLPELDDGAQTVGHHWLAEWGGSIASEPTCNLESRPAARRVAGTRATGDVLGAARPIGEVLSVLGTAALSEYPRQAEADAICGEAREGKRKQLKNVEMRGGCGRACSQP